MNRTGADAELVVLGFLVDFSDRGGATAAQVDRHMLQVGDEGMSLRDVQEALARCADSGDAVRAGVSALATVTYQVTEKGRARLRGEPS